MFQNEIIFFFARIDQQAKICHSSLSKQDSTKEQQHNKNKNTLLKQVLGGRNELYIRTPVDFDIVNSILRVLEGRELGNSGLYRKYWPYQKIIKIKKKIGSRESKKMIFRIFHDFLRKQSGNPEIVAGNLGISSETTRESRVRRPGSLGPETPGLQRPWIFRTTIL